jgi:hydroxypyruvate isomerase
MKYGVCLEMVFTDRPFLERIARVAETGFRFAEMWFIDGTFNGANCSGDPKDPDAVRQAAENAGVSITNTVVGSPDGSLGGGLIDPARRDEWLARLRDTLAFNSAAGIPATIVCTGNDVPGMSRTQMLDAVVEHLKPTAELAAKAGVTLLLESLNTRVDHAGYFLDSSDTGAAICRAVSSPNLKLLFDCYHMQIMQGDLMSHIRGVIDVIGHFHSAGVPGRNELFAGEIDYPFVVRQLETLGYDGVFAMEYTPTLDTSDSLRRTLACLP